MYRETLFDAAGSLRDDYYAVDWSRTPLGPPSDWSLALRNTVDLALHTDFAVTLLWGPELTLIYNAAYVELIADKHPHALGRPAHEVFPEAWDTIGPMLRHVLAGDGRSHNRDTYLPLQRRGRLEEAYFDFTYSPVRGADGLIEGVLDITAETTGRVIARRRLEVLNDLRELASTVELETELRARSLALLRAVAADFPAVELQAGAAEGDLARPPLPLRETTIATTSAGRVAWIPLAGSAGDRLAVRLSEHLAEDEDYVEFLELIAFTLAQALSRIRARETERDIAALEQRMSETLQLSMLTRPVGIDAALVATRYVAAAEQASIGGDWYDAFRLPDGAFALVIGDVTGHDRKSAASMAQVKSMLRALAVTIGEPPGAVLSALDRTMGILALEVYASAVFARAVPDPAGGMRLEWSNAGHPPPVMVLPDGTATLLERRSELMLGVFPETRSSHTATVPPGASIVLYTDGLVERRKAVLDDGFAQLLAALAGNHALEPEAMADHVLAMLPPDGDDDVAVLVLRVPEA